MAAIGGQAVDDSRFSDSKISSPTSIGSRVDVSAGAPGGWPVPTSASGSAVEVEGSPNFFLWLTCCRSIHSCSPPSAAASAATMKPNLQWRNLSLERHLPDDPDGFWRLSLVQTLRNHLYNGFILEEMNGESSSRIPICLAFSNQGRSRWAVLL